MVGDVESKIGKIGFQVAGDCLRLRRIGLQQEVAKPLLIWKHAQEIGFGNQELALKYAIRKSRHQAQAHIADGNFVAQLAVQHVGHGVGVGDGGHNSSHRCGVEQQPGISLLRSGLRQRFLKRKTRRRG